MLKLRVLGALSLTDGDLPVPGAASQRNRLALLAILAVAGKTGVSRDKLLAHLWPESDGERARHALKQTVYTLRKDFGGEGEDVIVGSASLTINTDRLASDVGEFETALARGDLAAAVDAYGGPFLDGFHLRDSPEFEHWCDEQRTRFAQLWSAAAEKLASEAEARGDWTEATTIWRRLAAAEPLNGRVALRLMRTLAENGDSAGALQHHRVHATLLREELGNEPDPEVTRLEAALRDGSFVRSPARPAEPAAPVPANNDRSASDPPSGNGGVVVNFADPTTVTTVVRTWRWPRFAAIGATVGVLATVGFFPAMIGREQWERLKTLVTRPPAVLDAKRVAVAPLDNETGDSTLAPVGYMAADRIASELLESGVVVVDAFTSQVAARVFEGTPRVLRPRNRAVAIAQETKAALVMVGSYYLAGDSVIANAEIVDAVSGARSRSLPPVKVRRDQPELLVSRLARNAVAEVATLTDTAPGARTVALTHPPSLEAYERTRRAWELYFAHTWDTTTVFAEFARALASDSSYAAPWLMKGYILDVNDQWPAVAAIVARLQPRRAQLSRSEAATLDLLDADLRGDLAGRLRTSREMMHMSPGSAEFPMLVAMSSLYLIRPAEALAAIGQSDPDRGLNLVSPLYWFWRAAAEHDATVYGRGTSAQEERTARSATRRFPEAPQGAFIRGRVLAVDGDERGIQRLLDKLPAATNDLQTERQDLMLFAGRELRAHGHDAAAKRLCESLARELASLPSKAPRPVLRRRAAALYESGNWTAARDAYAALVQSDTSDIAALGRLATSEVRLGNHGAAERVEARLRTANWTYAHGAPTIWRARLAALRGANQEAVSLLRQAVREGYRASGTDDSTIHLDADFAALMRLPWFVDVVRNLSDQVALPPDVAGR